MRDFDRLVLRAAVGLEESVKGTFSLAVGEGFAGTIAKTRQPLLTHSAQSDPLVRNPVLKMNGVKALYGVPLLYGDNVVGIVKMGSRTAWDFPAEERQIIRSAADRAAAFIAQKRTAEEQELLLHILGHDLRSPLQTIELSAVSVEQQESLSPAGRRKIARAIAAARRMDQVICDLTDFTATRRSRLVLERQKVDLYDLAAQTASEMRARTDRPIFVHRKGDTTGEWDRGRLFRVIVNLVNNALAYGAPATPVKIDVHGEDDWVSVCVHNEGEPIAPDLLPHLYEAFRRGNQGSGSGLGLYIVQQIARSHGGDVDSAAGRGTSFRVRLPRAAR